MPVLKILLTRSCKSLPLENPVKSRVSGLFQTFTTITKVRNKTGVLVAISIPIFTSQLEKAREATDEANIRSAYAECAAAALTETAATTTSSGVTVTVDGTSKVVTCTKTVPIKQQVADWSAGTVEIAGVVLDKCTVGANVTVTVTSDGTVSFKQGTTDMKKTS